MTDRFSSAPTAQAQAFDPKYIEDTEQDQSLQSTNPKTIMNQLIKDAGIVDTGLRHSEADIKALISDAKAAFYGTSVQLTSNSKTPDPLMAEKVQRTLSNAFARVNQLLTTIYNASQEFSGDFLEANSNVGSPDDERANVGGRKYKKSSKRKSRKSRKHRKRTHRRR